MKVTVKTKSNFKGLDGKWLPVVEARGNRVTIKHEGVLIDYHISEVVEQDNGSGPEPVIR